MMQNATGDECTEKNAQDEGELVSFSFINPYMGITIVVGQPASDRGKLTRVDSGPACLWWD
jgi:hypothetical protein